MKWIWKALVISTESIEYQYLEIAESSSDSTAFFVDNLARRVVLVIQECEDILAISHLITTLSSQALQQCYRQNVNALLNGSILLLVWTCLKSLTGCMNQLKINPSFENQALACSTLEKLLIPGPSSSKLTSPNGLLEFGFYSACWKISSVSMNSD